MTIDCITRCAVLPDRTEKSWGLIQRVRFRERIPESGNVLTSGSDRSERVRETQREESVRGRECVRERDRNRARSAKPAESGCCPERATYTTIIGPNMCARVHCVRSRPMIGHHEPARTFLFTSSKILSADDRTAHFCPCHCYSRNNVVPDAHRLCHRRRWTLQVGLV